MNYYSLREFIIRLEKENELVRIEEPVSPILQIAEITDRVSKQPGGGKALLFENVEGSEMPVLINAFGSTRRMPPSTAFLSTCMRSNISAGESAAEGEGVEGIRDAVSVSVGDDICSQYLHTSDR